MLRLVINLDRSPERLQKISMALKNYGLNFSRVQAVDGKCLTEDEVCQWTIPKLKRQLFFRDLSRAEIGCCLSHRKCWQMLVDSSEDWALIFEDDCVFSERALPFITNEKWIPEGIKLCQLSHLGNSGDKILIEKRKYDLNDGRRMIRVIKPHHIGTGAYYIHREVAKLALDATKTFEAPVDEMIFSLRYPFGRRYAGWIVNPYPVKLDTLAESTIGHETTRGFGKPCTLRQVMAKIFSRIYISIYRKVYGVRSCITFE